MADRRKHRGFLPGVSNDHTTSSYAACEFGIFYPIFGDAGTPGSTTLHRPTASEMEEEDLHIPPLQNSAEQSGMEDGHVVCCPCVCGARQSQPLDMALFAVENFAEEIARRFVPMATSLNSNLPNSSYHARFPSSTIWSLQHSTGRLARSVAFDPEGLDEVPEGTSLVARSEGWRGVPANGEIAANVQPGWSPFGGRLGEEAVFDPCLFSDSNTSGAQNGQQSSHPAPANHYLEESPLLPGASPLPLVPACHSPDPLLREMLAFDSASALASQLPELQSQCLLPPEPLVVDSTYDLQPQLAPFASSVPLLDLGSSAPLLDLVSSSPLLCIGSSTSLLDPLTSSPLLNLASPAPLQPQPMGLNFDTQSQLQPAPLLFCSLSAPGPLVPLGFDSSSSQESFPLSITPPTSPQSQPPSLPTLTPAPHTPMFLPDAKFPHTSPLPLPHPSSPPHPLPAPNHATSASRATLSVSPPSKSPRPAPPATPP
ncbi:hypothetical protein BDK51DRAFT_52255 [Blyttiomyces helicus]|uniref:Uncharacterized protein n=1 Tax=Blyttiomyces helicus TaxID=388810 RepID=A0A4P9W3Z7_9FUNG|nr:hypothetical protein BDK51DRAFT_52255 [Blyttiomyces helicus]|eukprot:RKO86582.1 hypothetical protein BDK51DRAFT_52255 [Blyttiomyces helicus]